MGVKKLEIELTDELLSKIERISKRTSHSTQEVVVRAIRELKDDQIAGADATQRRLAVLHEVSQVAKSLNIQRSDDDILSKIGEFRGET